MMTRRLTSLATALVLGAALAAPSGLQAQAGMGWGLEVDVGASVLAGDDFDGWDTGIDFTAVGSYAWATGWEVGAAAGFASHDVGGGTTPNAQADVQLNHVSAVFRKRFRVPSADPTHLHPYVEGRLGWIQADSDDAGSESGVKLGGGAGIEYWMSDQVSLTGGVNLGYVDIGDASGLRFVPRAGLKVRFGGS